MSAGTVVKVSSLLRSLPPTSGNALAFRLAVTVTSTPVPLLSTVYVPSPLSVPDTPTSDVTSHDTWSLFSFAFAPVSATANASNVWLNPTGNSLISGLIAMAVMVALSTVITPEVSVIDGASL